MVNLNDIYDVAEINEVTVRCFDMDKIQSLSCKSRKGCCFIAIDPLQLKTSCEEKVLLAHELGHCITDSFYNTDNLLDVRGRHEYRADRWAVQRLIPWPELQEVLEQGILETWELAEYFGVTEEFIRIAINVYQRQGKL